MGPEGETNNGLSREGEIEKRMKLLGSDHDTIEEPVLLFNFFNIAHDRPTVKEMLMLTEEEIMENLIGFNARDYREDHPIDQDDFKDDPPVTREKAEQAMKNMKAELTKLGLRFGMSEEDIENWIQTGM